MLLNLLIQAPTWEEFIRRFKNVMEAARAHRVYILKGKIQYGRICWIYIGACDRVYP